MFTETTRTNQLPYKPESQQDTCETKCGGPARHRREKISISQMNIQ